MAYMSGFGNEFQTEALPGALPAGRNSPQRCPYGLYAEQLSGSSFTAPQGANRRAWLYRIRPSVAHLGCFREYVAPLWTSAPVRMTEAPLIGPCRWGPFPFPPGEVSLIEGVRAVTFCGAADSRSGMTAGVYFATRSMRDEFFYDADGELLLIPQSGALDVATELGLVDVSPGEICVIPRGVKFSVSLSSSTARGYFCENFGAPFTLPNRGVIGANGLANARDFLTPTAKFDDYERPCRLSVKSDGRFYVADIGHSPLDVVAWHGNYAPYKYDLRNFCPMGALRFDHPDPSINCVLTSPSSCEGVGDVDLIVFPDRWQVAEDTFRPPWFHMNVMSEFMGLIFGAYDAKGVGFEPGGASLHNAMFPHGPDAAAVRSATVAELAPSKLEDTLAFMLETRLPQHVTDYAARIETRQGDYADCWKDLPKRFDGTLRGRE